MEILLTCYKMAKLIFATCAPARADSDVASATKPLALISWSDKLSRSFILAINIEVEKNCPAVKPPVSLPPLAGSLGRVWSRSAPWSLTITHLWSRRSEFGAVKWSLLRDCVNFTVSCDCPAWTKQFCDARLCDAARVIALIVWSFLRFPSLHTLSFR